MYNANLQIVEGNRDPRTPSQLQDSPKYLRGPTQAALEGQIRQAWNAPGPSSNVSHPRTQKGGSTEHVQRTHNSNPVMDSVDSVV